MHRLFSYTSSILLFIAAVSCQKHESGQRMGTILLSLDNSPAVEVVTKAVEEAGGDFRVYVTSSERQYSYFYREMESGIVVPSGMYTVAAENVSEAVSLSQPDLWGQPRYYGITEAKQVGGTTEATEYSLTCTMANAALSVIFDETIVRNFTDYKVVAYTSQDRRLEYTSANSAAVGYFSPALLHYEFSGSYKDYTGGSDDSEFIVRPLNVSGTKELARATHLNLTFRTSPQNGVLDLNITVDTRYENLYETVEIDPNAH